MDNAPAWGMLQPMTDEPFDEKREALRFSGYDRAQRDRLRKQLRDLGVEPDDQHPYKELCKLAGTWPEWLSVKPKID